MIKILQIIILVILSLLMMSASCDKGNEGCIDANACNYNKNAAIDDNSCWFKSTGCDCEDPPGSVIDCLGICDADILNDPPDLDGDGNCDEGVIGGCIDSLICNFNINATHNNDSCAVDLSVFGGLPDGTDCDGECRGKAVEDACQFCVGGESTLAGKSWRMSINATTVFSDSTRISDSAHIGASIFAEDGYNNENIIEADCNGCYIDFAENCGHADSLCFYFPHDEWKGEIDTIFTNGYNFDRDIRANNLHALFTGGLDWVAEISPIIAESVFIDSLLLDFTLLQGIESCIITVILDFGGEYEVQDNRLEIEVGLDKDIKLTFNISNICFSEF